MFFFLFKRWIDASVKKLSDESATNLKLLDIQNDKFLKSVDQANKRDEIRYSAFHAERIKRIADIYENLVDLRQVLYVGAEEEFRKKLIESWHHMAKSRIYFKSDLAKQIEDTFRLFDTLLKLKEEEKSYSGLLRTAIPEWQNLLKQRRELRDTHLPKLMSKLEDEVRLLFTKEDKP